MVNPSKEPAREIKIMTYNVWGSREDVSLFRRMQAIRDLVRYHRPDVIFFQEVTGYIVRMFDSLDIFKVYKHGRPFSSTNEECFCLLLSKLPLDRIDCSAVKVCPSCYYLHARIKPGSGMMPIHMATARLQSSGPEVTCGGHGRFCMAEQLVSELDGEENVLLGGDMCWDDDVDLPFPLRSGWVDAWTQLMPRADLASSWTYDAFWNEEVAAFNGFVAPLSSMKKRSDRFVCKLKDYDARSIEVIGSDGVGLQYRKENCKNPWDFVVDLLPSCHRGLVLTIAPNGPARASELDCESPDGRSRRTIFGDP